MCVQEKMRSVPLWIMKALGWDIYGINRLNNVSDLHTEINLRSLPKGLLTLTQLVMYNLCNAPIYLSVCED